MDVIPEEIITHRILPLLDYQAVVQLSSTNKHWKKYCSSEEVWTILVNRDFSNVLSRYGKSWYSRYQHLNRRDIPVYYRGRSGEIVSTKKMVISATTSLREFCRCLQLLPLISDNNNTELYPALIVEEREKLLLPPFTDTTDYNWPSIRANGITTTYHSRTTFSVDGKNYGGEFIGIADEVINIKVNAVYSSYTKDELLSRTIECFTIETLYDSLSCINVSKCW